MMCSASEESAACEKPCRLRRWQRTASYALCLLCFAFLNAATTADETTWRLIQNSAGISQVIDLNQAGQILGTKEVVDPGIGFSTEPFFYADGKENQIPTLDGFTHAEWFRLSDNGLAVGYASRAPGHPDGNTRAMIWNSRTDTKIALPIPDGYHSSCALDISADGGTVSGYTLGRDPPRMVPCVWEYRDESWHAARLSTLHDLNPFLAASRVVISDDGTKIAACLATSATAPFNNHLFLWRKQHNGSWQRQLLEKRGLKLANINDHGMIVGSESRQGKRHIFVYAPDSGFQIVPPLPGDVSGAANDVNNGGIVVGYSDDPPGREGGPQAFIWKQGKLSPLPFPRQTSFSMAAAINDRNQVGGMVVTATDVDEVEKTAAFVLQFNSD